MNKIELKVTVITDKEQKDLPPGFDLEGRIREEVWNVLNKANEEGFLNLSCLSPDRRANVFVQCVERV